MPGWRRSSNLSGAAAFTALVIPQNKTSVAINWRTIIPPPMSRFAEQPVRVKDRLFVRPVNDDGPNGNVGRERLPRYYHSSSGAGFACEKWRARKDSNLRPPDS